MAKNLVKTNPTSLRLFSCTNIPKQNDNVNNTANIAPKELFFIEDKRDKGYVIFRLNKAPVNSLTLEYLTELNIQMDKFQEARDIKGVILTSDVRNIFSAGLDIRELYQPKPDRLHQFWDALHDFWLKLYGSNKIFIAAINVSQLC